MKRRNLSKNQLPNIRIFTYVCQSMNHRTIFERTHRAPKLRPCKHTNFLFSENIKKYVCLISGQGVYHVWVLTRPGEYSSIEFIIVGVFRYARVVGKDAFNIFRVFFGGLQMWVYAVMVSSLLVSFHSLCSQSRLRCLRFFWRRPFEGGGNGWPGLCRGNRCLGGGFGLGTFSELLNWNSTNLNILSFLRDSLDSLPSGKTISDSRGKVIVMELGSGLFWARVNEHKTSDNSDKELHIFMYSELTSFVCPACASNVETRLKQACD